MAIVMLAACARSSQRAPSGAGDSVESITTGDVARQYRLHVSAAYQSEHSAPLVILRQGDATGEAWSGCHDGADVILYTIAGKGHSWPGSMMPAQITTRDIDATDVIWDFFAAHPKP